MFESIAFQNMEFFLQLTLATVLGAMIGVERELARKTAGMRTFALVSLGSALFSIISHSAMSMTGVGNAINYDPTRIAAQIISGVGFIGAGLIIFNQSKVQGITTAAGLWLSAAIGMAVGFKFYMVAVFTSFLALLIFVLFWEFEEKLIKKYYIRSRNDPPEEPF